MNHLKKNTYFLHFGLKKPVRILRLTDIHISLADDVDGDAMKEHAAHRRDVFFKEGGCPERDPVGYLEEAMEYFEEFDCTVITGDLLDFESHANRETAKEILAGRDYLFTPGSHEFCPKIGIPDTFAYKKKVWDEVQDVFRGNMLFESRIVGGVNVITMDNSFYIWTKEQFEMLKTEVARGYPIILFCHCPLHDSALSHKNPAKKLIPTEEEVESTITVNRYLAENPLIKTAFSGHYHGNGGEYLFGEKTGYFCAPLFKGIVNEIVID